MIIILTTLTQLLGTLFIMRFYMRLSNVGSKAPVASFVSKMTNPLTRLFNPFLPRLHRLDLASIIIAYGALVGQAYAISALGSSPDLSSLQLADFFMYAGIKTCKIFLDLVFFAILGTVILSWVSSTTITPINNQLIKPLTDWILEPLRRIMPNTGMIDFSPLIVLFTLQFIENFVLNPLLHI